MVKNVFTYWDILLGPIYLVVFFVIGYIYASFRYKKNNHVLFKHFLWGLILKFVGCLGFIAIYAFYYKGGDTFRYFHNALPLMDVFWKDPLVYIELLTKSRVVTDNYPVLTSGANSIFRYDMYTADTSYQVVRITAFFGLFSFKSYLVISLFFSFGSYIGVWCLYRVFTLLFPFATNALAIPILYFPSVFFWGSSIMKDSVVIGFVGLLTYSLYQLLFRGKKILFNLFLIVFSFIVLKTTKEYVIIAYLPALLFWLFLSTTNRFPQIGRLILRPILLVSAVVTIFFLAPQIEKISSDYALEQVLNTAETTGRYIKRISEESGGSAYDLGNIEYTPIGLLKTIPKGITVTMYRPFLYEVKNPVMLMSALESTIVLIFTLYVFFKVGLIRFFFIITKHPFLSAALVFSLTFAFAIGISTFNFGSLARYKIPCLPFYGVAFIVPLIESQKNKLKNQSPIPS